MWLRGIASNPQPPHRSGHGCTVGYDRDPPVWCPPPGRMRRDIRAPALTYTVCVGVHAVAHGRVCWRFFYCSLGSSARTPPRLTPERGCRATLQTVHPPVNLYTTTLHCCCCWARTRPGCSFCQHSALQRASELPPSTSRPWLTVAC